MCSKLQPLDSCLCPGSRNVEVAYHPRKFILGTTNRLQPTIQPVGNIDRGTQQDDHDCVDEYRFAHGSGPRRGSAYRELVFDTHGHLMADTPYPATKQANAAAAQLNARLRTDVEEQRLSDFEVHDIVQ